MKPVDTVRSSLARAVVLLAILDRQHSSEELHRQMRAVRHEVATAVSALAEKGEQEQPWPGLPPGIRFKPGSQRHRILSEVAARGSMTDPQIRDFLDSAGTVARVRRYELYRVGYLEPVMGDDGKPSRLRNSETGYSANLWKITDAGRKALGKLNTGQMVLALESDSMPEVDTHVA